MSDLVITPRSIIGTGDPFDAFFMVSLVHSWHPVRGCVLADAKAEHCDDPVTRIVIAARIEPEEAFTNDDWKRGIAFCEPHFKMISKREAAHA